MIKCNTRSRSALVPSYGMALDLDELSWQRPILAQTQTAKRDGSWHQPACHLTHKDEILVFSSFSQWGVLG